MAFEDISGKIIKYKDISLYCGPCREPVANIPPFIHQFCSKNEWLCEIDKNWLVDNFNIFGLSEYVTDIDMVKEVLTDVHSNAWNSLNSRTLQSILKQAFVFYGLAHARWICQVKGLEMMKSKYEKGVFGRCPRLKCKGQLLLPVGLTPTVARHTARVFCPLCKDLYVSPDHIKLDGAYFGVSFPHIFMVSYKPLFKNLSFTEEQFEIYGFEIHQTSLPSFRPHATNIHYE